MSRRYRFRQVDVFTDRVLAGNPLAVLPSAQGLSDAEMQALAREMNLSETAFVLAPSSAGRASGADYRVRIFTPGVELAFAGHPSIGTAWVLADEGRFELRAPRTLVRQELGIGVLPLSLTVRRLGPGRAGGATVTEVTMTQGPPRELHTVDADEARVLCDALGVETEAVGWPGLARGASLRRRGVAPAIVSTGLPHLVIPFVDRGVMLAVSLGRRTRLAEVTRALGCDSAALVAPGGSGAVGDADVSVRVFDPPGLGIAADPATGSAAGPIAVHLGRVEATRDGTFRLVIEQGTELGRPSRLVAEADFDPAGHPTEARVAGCTVPVIDGWVTLP